MGLFDEDLYTNRAKAYMNKAYRENGRTEFKLEEIVELANGTFVDQEPSETIYTEQQMTDAIKRQNPAYTPDPERMAHDASMIPQVREAVSKGVLNTVNPFILKLATTNELAPGRENTPMINYAHVYCADQTAELEARGMKLVDEYNAAKSDIKALQSLATAASNKEKHPSESTERAYETAFAIKDSDSEIIRQAKKLSGTEFTDYVKGHEAQQKERFTEINSIKGKMSRAACSHLVKHIGDTDPVTGRTLSDTLANHMNTPEEIIANYPDAYVKMKAIAECEMFLKDGTISESELGVEDYRKFVTELNKTMPLTMNVSYRTTAYASPLCGIIDIDQMEKGGNLSIEGLSTDIQRAHPAVSQIFNLSGTASAQYTSYLKGVTGSGSLTYQTEDGKVIQQDDITNPENSRAMFQQGKLIFAVANDKPGQKPTPFMFDRQGKIYVGDDIAKHAAEMKEPKMDPAVKKPSAFSRFLGNISNSLKSDAVRKWDKAVADFDAAKKEYQNFRAYASKTTPQKLDAARNKVDAENAKKEGKSLAEYQKEKAAEEKAAREAYNSKLFEEANAEVAAEKEQKAEARKIIIDQAKQENAQVYNKDKLLDAFAKQFPEGIPEQLRKNIEKISNAALESKNRLTETVNNSSSVKGAEIKDDLKNTIMFSEMLQAAESGKLTPEKIEVYSHPQYPAIAGQMLDKNQAVSYAGSHNFNKDSFREMILDDKLISGFGDFFARQIQDGIDASKEMTFNKANGITGQPKLPENKHLKNPSVAGPQ